MIITHKNISFEVEPLKYCKFLDGVRIYLFHVLKQPVIDGEYIVAVKRDNDTLYFMHFIELQTAKIFYLHKVCLYA